MSRLTFFAAVAQFSPHIANVARNAADIAEMVKKIKKDQPETDLIVFPEICLYGYDQLGNSGNQDYQVALFSAIEFLKLLAHQEKVNLIVGYPYYDDSTQKLYNRIVYLSRKKDILYTYDKMHLIPYDQLHFQKGNQYVLLKTEIGTIGFLICWDICFPEIANLYASNGADILVLPSAWEKPFDEQFSIMVKARAIENDICILAANQVGRTSMEHYFGNSMIVMQSGEVLGHTTGNGNRYIIRKINMNKEENSDTQKFGVPLCDRREETYNVRHLNISDINL